MSVESRVLSNIPYTIHNRSNYDIVTEETRDIVDVPYFPAQNLVDVSGSMNLYQPNICICDNCTNCIKPVRWYVPFLDSFGKERFFALIQPVVVRFQEMCKIDARYRFVEFGDDSRYLHYQFAGTSFPQTKDGDVLTYTGRKLYLFGGSANGRTVASLWEFDLDKNTWTDLNFQAKDEKNYSGPTPRLNSSITWSLDKFWVFGGQTDILVISPRELEISSNEPFEVNQSTLVRLNDLWSFDPNTGMWTNYDRNRILPHRPGIVVHADNNEVHIYIEGGVNDVGQTEPAAIWVVNLSDDSVTFQPYSAPFTLSPANVVLNIHGTQHVLVGSDLYKYDPVHKLFTLVLSNIAAYNPQTDKYWTVEDITVNFGDQPDMGSAKVTVPHLYDSTGTLVKDCTINLPPRGKDIPSVNIDNVAVFFYGGLIDNDHFNESTYLMNNTTRYVHKFDFSPDQRPTERVFHSMTYDRYRGRIWLFGGTDGTTYYNDLWYFDLGAHTWTKVQGNQSDTQIQPSPRGKAAIALVNTDYLYLIGGYSDKEAFSDFWVYDIKKGEWSQVLLTDNIPWGSAYYLFEWRDRLWFYNGQKLYRFFYRIHQFVDQPLYISQLHEGSTDPITQLIESKKYLDTPVHCNICNGQLYIENPDFSFIIDLETRVVTNLREWYRFPKFNNLMLDKYLFLDRVTLSDYYINVSPLQPLTKNQLPSSWFSGTLQDPDRFGHFVEVNLPTEVYYRYFDLSGEFVIKRETLEKDKGELLVDRVVSAVGFLGELPDSLKNVDFSNPDSVWAATVDQITKPTAYLYTPRFLYSKYKPMVNFFSDVQKVFVNKNSNRLYLLYGNGNVVKLNPVDNTFYTYFSRIWKGSAVGYLRSEDKLFAFGGFFGDRSTYMQNGLECVKVDKACAADSMLPQCTNSGNTECICEQMSHCGLLEFDLKINELLLGSLQNYLKEQRVTIVDYTKTRDYLISMVDHYIQGYTYNTIPESIEEVKHKIYTATRPIVDDLSNFDFVFDRGERPLGRAYAISAQVNDKLFVFGGCCSIERHPVMSDTECCCEKTVPPYWAYPPGYVEKMFLGWDIDLDEEAVKAFMFDMSTRTWKRIKDLPHWLYMSSAIVSKDNRYIYIVGGCMDVNCTKISNEILRYDVERDEYTVLLGVPASFSPRALPILHWLDEEHLLIMYGVYVQNLPLQGKKCPYVHWPVSDAWILDIRSNLMYQTFKDLAVPMGIVAQDTFNVNEKAPNSVYILTPVPFPDNKGNPVLPVYKWDLVSGDVKRLDVAVTQMIEDDWNLIGALATPPVDDHLQTQSGLPPGFAKALDMSGQSNEQVSGGQSTGIDNILSILGGKLLGGMGLGQDILSSLSSQTNIQGLLSGNYGAMDLSSVLSTLTGQQQGESSQGVGEPIFSVRDMLSYVMNASNFRLRYAWVQPYGEYDHLHMFIVGERCDESGIEAIREMARGYKEAHLRFWKVDLELPYPQRKLESIVYEYPLPISPVLISYDGTRYLYVIYNKYNIWRLDFMQVLKEPDGSWWSQLPPCIDCNFLGDERTSDEWHSFYIDPHYLTLVSLHGQVARMDTDNFTWFIDKLSPPVLPLTDWNSASYKERHRDIDQQQFIVATGVDQDELYMYFYGGIAGKVMNVYQREWDDFFFDMRVTSRTYLNFSDVIAQGLWPTVLRRRRLYTMNELGHIFYSWLRIDGVFDVEYQLQDYYQGDEIRVYGDYSYLQNWQNTKIWVKKIDGQWQEIDQSVMTAVTNEVGWDWDGNYMRRYIRQFYDNSTNQIVTQYSKVPPNYLKIDLSTALGGQIPINKIRVRFKNTVKPYNYMTHINRVDLITYQDNLAMYDSPTSDTPLQIIHIAPMQLQDGYSNVFGVTIKNTHPSKSVKDVIVYAWDNNWIQFSMDPADANSWTIRDQNNPFFVTDELAPNEFITFYIRAVNIDLRPHMKDLVVKGVFAYS